MEDGDLYSQISNLKEKVEELEIKQASRMKQSSRIDQLIAEVKREDGRVSVLHSSNFQ